MHCRLHEYRYTATHERESAYSHSSEWGANLACARSVSQERAYTCPNEPGWHVREGCFSQFSNSLFHFPFRPVESADIQSKLRWLGFELAPAYGMRPSEILISDADVEEMARREH